MEATIHGYWWRPGGSIDTAVAGTLSISPGRLPVLQLMGSLDDEPSLFRGRAEHVILGVTDEGRRTTLLRVSGSTGLRQRDMQMYSERWIAQAALLGTHAENAEQARFQYADVELDVLPELTRSGLTTDASGDSRQWQWERPQVATAKHEDLTVEIDIAPHGGLVDQATHELRFWAVPRLRLTWNAPVSLGTLLMEGLYPLTDLCSLLSGSPATVERVVLHANPPGAGRFTPSEVELLTNPARRANDFERDGALVATFDESPVAPSDLIPAWLALYQEPPLRELIDRFFSQDGRPSPFPEPNFLGYAVFLEGFHKAVHNAGEASFIDRLKELITTIAVILEETNSDPDMVTETIRDTRNTLAHGRRRPTDQTVEGSDLVALNRLMDLLVRGLLLHRVGFSQSDLKDLLSIGIIRMRNMTAEAPWTVSV